VPAHNERLIQQAKGDYQQASDELDTRRELAKRNLDPTRQTRN